MLGLTTPQWGVQAHIHGSGLVGHGHATKRAEHEHLGARAHRVLGMYFLATPGWEEWSDDEQEEGPRCEKPTEQAPSSTGSTTRKRRRNQATPRSDSVILWVRPLLGVRAALGRLVLLGQQDRVDVGQHAARRDGHTAQELVELLVIADGEQTRKTAQIGTDRQAGEDAPPPMKRRTKVAWLASRRGRRPRLARTGRQARTRRRR